MKLTVGKKINGSFMILALVSSITGGLILYWLINLTAANRTVLSIHTPSMIEAERLLRYYGLAIGGIKGFIAFGDEKYLQDYENAKMEIKESYEKLKGLSKNWIIPTNRDLLEEIEKYLNKLYASANQLLEIRSENDYKPDLKYLREELSPLMTTMQNSVDQIEINMAKLLENEVQTALRLQKSIWFISSIAICVSVVAGIFIVVFNTKYLILSWPRKLARPS